MDAEFGEVSGKILWNDRWHCHKGARVFWAAAREIVVVFREARKPLVQRLAFMFSAQAKRSTALEVGATGAAKFWRQRLARIPNDTSRKDSSKAWRHGVLTSAFQVGD